MKAKNTLVLGDTRPEIRLFAFQGYMRGHTLARVAQEVAAQYPPGIPYDTLKKWSQREKWGEQRTEMFIELRRAQLISVTKELASDVRTVSDGLNVLLDFTAQYFYRPRWAIDPITKEVLKDPITGHPTYARDANGKLLMTMRGPQDWEMETPTDAIHAMVAVLDRKVALAKLVGEFIGGVVPKLDLETYTATDDEAPTPVQGDPNGKAP